MPRIAFWGTPELTAVYLDALLSAGMAPVVVVANPDRPRGRGHVVAAPASKLWAEAHHTALLQPEKLDDDFYAKLSAFDLDVSIVVAYGKIIPQKLIDLPKHKTLNVHYSLLPQYRGPAPTESAILAGDAETGSAIQIMARALDSGPIIAVEKTPIGPDETTSELRARLTEIGTKLLVETLPKYLDGSLAAAPQDESLATHSGKIKKEDGLLDLSGNALSNYRKYRAYSEWPRTYFIRNAKRIIITQAHMENAAFVIDRVIPEGKKEISYADFSKNS